MARRGFRLIDDSKKQWRRFGGTLPILGAAAIGGVGTAIAAAIGAGELIVGAAAAYAGYKYLRTGETARQAAKEGAKVAQGKAPKSRKAA